jgi:Fe-S cluster assembly protein SufD
MTHYTDITNSKKKNFRISTPGIHVYYFTNISADFSFTVAHEKSEVYVFGLYTGTGKDVYRLVTRQKHTAPGAQSHIMIKGVFDDHSRFSYEGMIHLIKKATKTNASLESRNILLSDHAQVTAKPQLEILPADVRCTHAATIAHINKEHTDFLMSRGLDEIAARNLLVNGFLQDLCTQLQERVPQAHCSFTL